VKSTSTVRDALRVNVLFYRAKLALSQAALAERAGISRALLSSIERGTANTGIDIVEKIGKVFGKDAAFLIAPINTGGTDDDIVRRLKDGPEDFVDAEALFAVLEEADEPVRYSKRGRKPIPA
jgi:transcriptional regulator with XRE-family HTH domain